MGATTTISTSYAKQIADIIKKTDWSIYGFKNPTEFINEAVKNRLAWLGLLPLKSSGHESK